MQKVLKIIFKSSASIDYILPYFYIKNKEKKYNVDFLAWDFSPDHLKKKITQKKIFTLQILYYMGIY